MPFRKPSPWGSVKPPAGSPLSRAHPLAVGLRGRYLFNEGAGAIGTDLARLNHAAITAPGWLPGKFGKTLNLNGSTSYAKLGSVVQTQAKYTVAFWVYERSRVTNDGDPAAAHVLFTINDGSSFNEYSSSNGVIFYVTTGNAWASTGITFPLATWTHLVFSVLANTLNLYVNGVFAVQKTNAQNDSRLFPILLGAWQDNSANAPSKGYMDGMFDSVSVFDRAVGPTEALALFNEPFADIYAPRRRIISQVAAAAGGFKPYWASQRSRVIGAGVR